MPRKHSITMLSLFDSAFYSHCLSGREHIKAEEQYSAQIAVMQSAVSAIAQGDHDAATKDFKSFSNNGTNLSHICWFAAELMRHNVLDEGLEIIYGNINLPEEDMIQLEVFLSKLF